MTKHVAPLTDNIAPKTFISMQTVNSYSRGNNVESVFHPVHMFYTYFGEEFNHSYTISAPDGDPAPVRTKFYETLDQYNYTTKSEIYHNLDNDKYCSNTYFHILAEHELIIMVANASSSISFVFFYVKETEEIAKLKKIISSIVPEKKTHTNKFAIVCNNKHGFFLKEFDLPKLSNSVDYLDIFDCYEDNFKEELEHVVASLNNLSKGLVLLHGKPGSGKTTLLRHLIRTLEGKKQVIYMPPDMVHFLSKPEFVTFMLDYKNSILIIEDAENILKTREAGESQSVSNILNLSDGILGDALCFQLIATFNSRLEDVDEALRRPGRLIAEIHFDSLSLQKTNDLIQKVYDGEVEPVEKPLTLAEIFNLKKKKFKITDKKSKVGFV